MSLVTVSEKGARVYARRFDHDEARRLHTDGWSYVELAELFGVSSTAVKRVCDPALRARMDARVAEYFREQREPCKGGCGTLVWAHMKNRSGYCPSCYGKVRSAPNERPDELRCTKCGEWKPDDNFHCEARSTRRGHRSHCRSCETQARARNRAENSERERTDTKTRKRRNSKKLKEGRMAEFVVLTQNGAGLKEVGRVEAVSRLHAVEQVAQEPGEYLVLKVEMLKPFTVAPVTRLSVVRDNGDAPTA